MAGAMDQRARRWRQSRCSGRDSTATRMTNADIQNPVYPDDANLSGAELNALMRERSMARAQSPGELICKLDTDSSNAVGYTHTHPSDQFMDYRHNNVEAGRIIADGDPWMYWRTYDQWADI